jgi:hypothetical protein
VVPTGLGVYFQGQNVFEASGQAQVRYEYDTDYFRARSFKVGPSTVVYADADGNGYTDAEWLVLGSIVTDADFLF